MVKNYCALPILSQEEFLDTPLSQRKRGRKRPEDITDPVLKRIFTLTGWASQADICRELDEDQSTLSRNLGQGHGVPEIYLLKLYYRFPVRMEWLRDGTGTMYRDDLRVDELEAPLCRTVRSLLGASKEALEYVERVARLVSGDHPDTMRDVRVAINGVELEASAWIHDLPDIPG